MNNTLKKYINNYTFFFFLQNYKIILRVTVVRLDVIIILLSLYALSCALQYYAQLLSGSHKHITNFIKIFARRNCECVCFLLLLLLSSFLLSTFFSFFFLLLFSLPFQHNALVYRIRSHYCARTRDYRCSAYAVNRL